MRDRATRGNLAKHFQSRTLATALGAAIVLLSLILLGYFVYRNWATLTAYHWRFDPAQLALTVLLHLCAFFIAIWAWHSIIKRLAGASDLRLNARIYCYSAVARRLPGIAWDIATRVVMYDQAGVSKAVAGVASLLEFLLINLAGVVFYVALTPLTLSYTELSTWPLVSALALGLALTHPRLVTYVVRKVKKHAMPVSLRYRDTVQWLLIYILSWSIGGLLLYATVRSIYDALSPAYALQVIADWTLVGVITSFMNFVPMGLGLKEVTLTVLMSRYMPEYIAVAAAIFMRLLMTAYSILWMLVSTRL